MKLIPQKNIQLKFYTTKKKAIHNRILKTWNIPIEKKKHKLV